MNRTESLDLIKFSQITKSLDSNLLNTHSCGIGLVEQSLPSVEQQNDTHSKRFNIKLIVSAFHQ